MKKHITEKKDQMKINQLINTSKIKSDQMQQRNHNEKKKQKRLKKTTFFLKQQQKQKYSKKLDKINVG